MPRSARNAAPTEKLRGKLTDFRSVNADGWGFGTVETTHEGGKVRITGKLTGVKPGAVVELEGLWKQHPQYGRQFAVTNCEEIVPDDAAGVIGWLSSNLPQVSARRAEEMVSLWGVQGTWDVLDTKDAEKLCTINGINEERAGIIFTAYAANKATRDRMVRFKWGLTDNQVRRVLEAWGDAAEQKILANPYELAAVVDGFGWTKTDEVAMRMGVTKELSHRLCAGMLHLLGEAAFSGHMFMVNGKLVDVAAKKILGVDPGIVWAELRAMEQRGAVLMYGNRVYLKKNAHVEASIAIRFAGRIRKAS